MFNRPFFLHLRMKSFQHILLLLILYMLSEVCVGQRPYPFVKHNNMEIFELPQELIEISGLIDVDTAFLAIQDESGCIYLLTPNNFAVRSKLNFSWAGDYEAMVEKEGGVWVVDSRGILFDLTNDENSFHVNNILQLPDTKHEFEGIWQDSNLDELYLISRKSQKRGKTPGDRYIWMFDQIERNLERYLQIPLDEVWQKLLEFSNINTWRYTVNKNLPLSDLTKDLKSQNWLILCSKPAAVIVLDSKGSLVDVIELDSQILPQPEALCFDHNGNLIIASEGLLGPARIVRYKKLQKK